MTRRLVPVLTALTTLTAVIALALPASAAPAPPQVLGRRAVTYTSYPNDPTPTSKWVSSSQGEFIDTNANGIRDSLRGRGADLETYGIIRFREDYVRLQVNRSGSWVTRLARETDVVTAQARAYGIIRTPSALVCRTDPTLTDTYRVVHSVLFRRSDNVVGRRTLPSATFTARLLASDPRCPETPPPPPPPPTTAADLDVAVTDSPDPVQHNQRLTYTVVARNTGDATASGARLVIDTDERLSTYTLESVPAGTTCAITTDIDPGTPELDEGVICDIGALSAGESAMIRVSGVATEVASDYDTIAVLTSTTAGVTDAEDTEITNVVASADLELIKTAAATASTTDDPNLYEFSFRTVNHGPDDNPAFTVTDEWPTSLDDPTVVPAGCTFDDPNDRLICAGAGPADTESVTFTVTAPVLASGSNTATTDSDRADPDPANNTDSASYTFTAPTAA
jgi:hypothetical protein